MSKTDVEHRRKAIEAIEAAESAGPDQSEAGQVYGLVAIAQALLAPESVLVDIPLRARLLDRWSGQYRGVSCGPVVRVALSKRGLGRPGSPFACAPESEPARRC
jgi:hypothetical protein